MVKHLEDFLYRVGRVVKHNVADLKEFARSEHQGTGLGRTLDTNFGVCRRVAPSRDPVVP